MAHYVVSERHACEVVQQSRRVQRYQSVKPRRDDLRQRMHQIAATRVRYGYRRIRVLLQREGWQVGQKLIFRLYQEEGLALRKRPLRRRRYNKMRVQRESRLVPQAPNQAWTLDFMSDQLSNGQRFRVLTIVDVFTREALAIKIGQRLKAPDVVEALSHIITKRGTPERLFCDNGSEFSGQVLDLWAYHHRVHIDFSRPGKPTDNAFIETFNGRLRDECLNVHWFESIKEAEAIIRAWQADYNESRPHMALKGMTPAVFAEKSRLGDMTIG